MYQVHTMNCSYVFMVELMVSTNSNELHLYNVMRLDDGRGQSVLYGILCLARLSGTCCLMLFFGFRSDFWHVDICVVLGLNGQ
jgi:hypothetical protein